MRPFDPEDFARSLMGLNGEEQAEPVVLTMDREPELFEPTNDAESESASPEMEEPPSVEEVGFEDLGETDEYAATGEHDEHVDDEETEETAEVVTTDNAAEENAGDDAPKRKRGLFGLRW